MVDTANDSEGSVTRAFAGNESHANVMRRYLPARCVSERGANSRRRGAVEQDVNARCRRNCVCTPVNDGLYAIFACISNDGQLSIAGQQHDVDVNIEHGASPGARSVRQPRSRVLPERALPMCIVLQLSRGCVSGGRSLCVLSSIQN